MPVAIENLLKALQASWAADTCFDASEWTSDNPSRGQCVASSLVVQYYLGGDLIRYRVEGADFKETHYCNILPDKTILDTTGAQYSEPVTLVVEPVELKGFSSVRDKRLAEAETRARYETLLQRVEARLGLIVAEPLRFETPSP